MQARIVQLESQFAREDRCRIHEAENELRNWEREVQSRQSEREVLMPKLERMRRELAEKERERRQLEELLAMYEEQAHVLTRIVETV